MKTRLVLFSLTDFLVRKETEEPYEWKASRTDLWGGRRAIAASTRKFKFDILVYFHLILALPNMRATLLCTSDILESAFGKYKTYLSNNPMAGITDLALCIAAFTCSLTPDAITEALEHSRERDVAQWTRLYFGPTLLKQRQQAFSTICQDEEQTDTAASFLLDSPRSDKPKIL